MCILYPRSHDDTWWGTNMGGSDILASCLEEGVAVQISPNIASLDALEGAHLVIRCQLIMSSDIIIYHQMSSDVIRCHQMSSDVIRCHQMSSDVISLLCHHYHSSESSLPRSSLKWGRPNHHGRESQWMEVLQSHNRNIPTNPWTNKWLNTSYIFSLNSPFSGKSVGLSRKPVNMSVIIKASWQTAVCAATNLRRIH